MKFSVRYVAICLFFSLAMWAQAGQNTDRPSLQGPPTQPEDRPTLRPRSGPGLDAGPDSSTTNDIRKLTRIHTLYIENIDNSLSDKLIEAIGSWGRFRVVTKAKDADAKLGGTCLESRRLKHVHSEIYISDRNGAPVWQDSIYRPFSPPALEQAVTDTAAVVKAHLQQSVREAERR